MGSQHVATALESLPGFDVLFRFPVVSQTPLNHRLQAAIPPGFKLSHYRKWGCRGWPAPIRRRGASRWAETDDFRIIHPVNRK